MALTDNFSVDGFSVNSNGEAVSDSRVITTSNTAVSISADGPLSAKPQKVTVDSSGGTVDPELPALSSVASGAIISIQCPNGAANTVTVQPNGSDVIRGSSGGATPSVTKNDGFIVLLAAVDWIVLAEDLA